MSAGLIAAIMAVFELPPDKNETKLMKGDFRTQNW